MNEDWIKVIRAAFWSVAVVMILFAVVGCATAPLTDDQQYAIDDKRIRDADVWRQCLQYYKRRGLMTVHMNHQHDRRTGAVRGSPMRRRWALREDVFYNGCNQVILQPEDD